MSGQLNVGMNTVPQSGGHASFSAPSVPTCPPSGVAGHWAPSRGRGWSALSGGPAGFLSGLPPSLRLSVLGSLPCLGISEPGARRFAGPVGARLSLPGRQRAACGQLMGGRESSRVL